MCKRVIIVTDGIFSMRGDHAPLQQIANIAYDHNANFEEGIITVVDDSHGVGTIAETGRGTSELTKESRIDVLIGTLGKAMGVNGGYMVSSSTIIKFLRETAPMYVYSNPITAGEASTALKALQIIDSEKGRNMLKHLHDMARYFRNGSIGLKYEVIPGEHPIVPVMIRDAHKLSRLVAFLKEHGIMATGISYPVVPRGDDEIRFQVCADHTKHDIDHVLNILDEYRKTTE